MHDVKLPLGPYHPLLKEPEHIQLYVKGEEIVNAEYFLGYNHRGIEKLIESRTYDKLPFLIERICGICPWTHNLSFIQNIEKIADIKVNKRVSHIRTLMAELERLHSHYLWFSVFSYSMGFQTLFMYGMNIREKVLDMIEMITGNRVHYDLISYGGLRRDVSKHKQMRIIKTLKTLKKKSKEFSEIFFTHKVIEERLKNIGILKKELAEELCVVGPMARASGIKIDTRKTDKYYSYGDIDFSVITRKKGDCLSRAKVRMGEIFESMKIIKQLIPLPKGTIKGKQNLILKEDCEASSRSEAPRGENFHYMLSGKIKPERIRIRPPTYANFVSLPFILKGYQISDAAPIVMSIDPCFSCTDRVAIIDVETNKKKIVDFDIDISGKNEMD